MSSEFRNRFRGWGEGAQACHADLCTNERYANNNPRKRTTRRLFGRQTLSQSNEPPADRGRRARGEVDLDKTHECPAPLLRLAVVKFRLQPFWVSSLSAFFFSTARKDQMSNRISSRKHIRTQMLANGDDDGKTLEEIALAPRTPTACQSPVPIRPRLGASLSSTSRKTWQMLARLGDAVHVQGTARQLKML